MKSKLKESCPNRFTRYVRAVVVGIGCMVGFVAASHASYTIDIFQSGSDVVADGSGSVDLTDLSVFGSPASMALAVNGAQGYVSFTTNPVSEWSDIGGPSEFGSDDNLVIADSSSETGIGVFGGLDVLLAPVGYNSGSVVSGSDTWNNTSLSDLGLTVGQYVWTWGSGPDADSLTVNVEAVPEPATLELILVGTVGACLLRVRSISQP